MIRTEPVATFFKMPWKYHLPCLPFQADTVQAALHLIGEAAPWMVPRGVSRTGGYAFMSLARIGSQSYQLFYKPTNRWEKFKIILDMTSAISPLLMVASRISPSFFIASQMGKTAIELKENILLLRNIRQLNSEQISDTLIPIVSQSLYLIAMLRTKSYQFRLVSILFQGIASCYQAYKLLRKDKKLEGLIWGLIAAVRLYSGYRYYQLKSGSPQFVYKQRHANKRKDMTPAPLSDRGHKKSRLAGPVVERYLQEKTGKTQWIYAASTQSRSWQTAQGMLAGVGRPDQTIFIDARLHERIYGESKDYMHAREEAAIDDLIDEVADPQAGFIVVDHSIVGKHYARRVDITNPVLAKKNLHYLEGLLFKRQEGQTELLERFKPNVSGK